jgi:hypothetical protein
VELVEERRIRGEMRLHERARLLVPRPFGDQPVTGERPARVAVGHEHRTARRVEQDRVHGLRTEAGDAQHLATLGRERRPAHAADVAAKALAQPAGERRQAAGLDPIGARGARTEPPRERDVEPQQTRLRGIGRRPGDPSPAQDG